MSSSGLYAFHQPRSKTQQSCWLDPVANWSTSTSALIDMTISYDNTYNKN